MKRQLILIFLGGLAAACAAEAPTTSVPERDIAAAATATPSTVRADGPTARPATGDVAAAAAPDLNRVPQAACEPGNYAEFVNAFAQFVHERSRFATDTGRAQLPEFDLQLVDYQWRRQSDGAVIDLEIHRNDAHMEVSATPVELDADENVAQTLGPPRRYVFEHRDGCWRYEGLR